MDIIQRLKEHREAVLTYLKQTNHHYGTKEINLEVGDKKINYHRWLHPYQGNWEIDSLFNEKELNNTSKLIKPHSIVLDIGAQTGNMAVAYSLFAKNVIAFEPNPATFEVLEKNSQHNPITPYNFACSTTEGDCEFHYSDPGLCNGGYASILNKGIGVTGHSLPLDIYTVNIIKFLKEYHPDDINNISFIKIDAEGHDKDILPTLKEIVDINDPIIQTEIYDGLTPNETDQLIKAINNLGYKAYDMDLCGNDIENIKDEIKSYKDINPGSGHNLICLKS
jgi:FkbM family methyltransferase